MDIATKHLIGHYLSVADEMGLLDERGWDIDSNTLRRNMTYGYRAEFLHEIKPVIDARQFSATGVFMQIELGPTARDADFILDALHFHQLLGGEEYLQSSALTSLLDTYAGHLPITKPYRKADDAVQKQAITIMRFVRAFQSRDPENDWDWSSDFPDGLLKYDGQHMGRTYTYTIKEANMVEFVLENSESLEQIIDIIKIRETTRIEEIKAVLSKEGHGSLTPGVL